MNAAPAFAVTGCQFPTPKNQFPGTPVLLGVGSWSLGVDAFFSIPLQIFLEELVLTAFAGGAPRRLGLPQLDAADLS